MYSSEKNPGINWKDLIIKAIFLVIFLLLLVWLFPSVPNMKPFYSNVFRENIKYMQEAGESYYTDERLPKNIGDTAEMTLQEMINKNLIIPFVDEDGNECDTYSSYVQVKKNEKDYTLKVNLVCPKEKNYVEKTLGCYTYCEDDSCKQELEYQFKKETTTDKTLYSCPNGGTLSNGMCNVYKTDSYKASSTTAKGEYYCPNGGTLSGTTCHISAQSSYNASISSGNYYCPYGGTLNGSQCYVKESSSYQASTSYYCPNGGTLSGTLCYYSTTTSGNSYVAEVMYYVCPDGSTSNTPTCRTTSTTNGSTYNASIRNYTCPNGTVQNSSICKVISSTADTVINATPKTTTKTIKTTTTKGSGYTLISAGYEYTCSNHALCPKRVYYYTYSYKTTTYTCPTGYKQNGTKCTKPGTTSTSNVTGKANYYCPSGGTLQGTKCVKAGSSSITESMGVPRYYCPTGTLSNGRCYVTGSTINQNYAATQERTCPNGGRLEVGRCIIDTSYTYNASKNADQKYCPNGGTLSGNKCIVDKSSNYQASLSKGETIYTCPNGGELKDKTCYITKLSNSYKATATTKKVSSVSYKWSKEEKLEGWTKTGETRIAASSLGARS